MLNITSSAAQAALAIDYESLGYEHTDDFTRVVDFLLDWQAGNEVSRDPAHAAAVARSRARHPWGALSREHNFCHGGWLKMDNIDFRRGLPASDLSRRRPGAEAPHENCGGCPFTYFGPPVPEERPPQRRQLTRQKWHWNYRRVAA